MINEPRQPLPKDKKPSGWHLEDIRAIKKVASAKGLDIVLNSSETQLGVFYSSDGGDFTEEVIYLKRRKAVLVHCIC